MDNSEVIKFGNKNWPPILKAIKENAGYERASFTPLYISKKNDPFVSLTGSGCSFHERGGCTMCGYRIRNKKNNRVDYADIADRTKKAMRYFENANKVNEKRPYYFYGIGTGGSFFDPAEIPLKLRKYIYREIRRITPKGKIGILNVISRLEYVNDEVLNEARELLGNKFSVIIGYGLESTNELIREACVNKNMPGDWQAKIDLMKRHKVLVHTHILVKPPFLTEEEAVFDAVKSVKEVFARKLSYHVVLMVMRLMPHTAVAELNKRGRYDLPSIWSVIEIVKKLGPDICRNITLNGLIWTENERETDALPGAVRGCRVCTPALLPRLIEFKSPNAKQWSDMMKTAESIHCDCKKEYYVKFNRRQLFKDFDRRIIDGIRFLHKDILGKSTRD